MKHPIRTAVAGLLAVSLALPASPVSALPRERDAWSRTDTGHFVLFSNASERSTRQIASNLERLREVVSQITGVAAEADRPMYLYVFDSNVSMTPYKPLYNGKPANVGGFFFFRPEGFYMVLQDDAMEEADRILYHEYLHLVLGKEYGDLPLWFNEGMAELYSTFKTTEKAAEIGRPVEDHVRFLRGVNLIPLSQLFAVDRSSKDYNEGFRQGIFYAQSWALVHYLLLGNPARREQTLRFFKDMAEGTPAAQAFRSAFQTEEAQIEKELRDYVRRNLFNYVQIPVAPAAELKLRVEPLPRQETLTRLGDLLSFQEDRAQHAQAAEHFRAALAVQPGYGPAQAGLCRLTAEGGDRAAALACYEKAAQALPDDFALQLQHGRELLQQSLDQATLARARVPLARAAALRPESGEAWLYLAQTFVHEEPLSPEGVRAFETLWRLRPAEPFAAEGVVMSLARSGQRDKAAELIEKEIAPRLPGQVSRVWQIWVSEAANQANRLVTEQKLEEALPLLEEVVRRAPADAARPVSAQLPELRRVVERNRFVKRYNEAVALLSEQKTEEAHVILQELVAGPGSPEDLEAARKLLGEVEAFLKQVGKKGKG